jgi:hypothetical protein
VLELSRVARDKKDIAPATSAFLNNLSGARVQSGLMP